jgi:hypothetical protein
MIHAKKKRRCSVLGFKRFELPHDLWQGMLVKGRYNNNARQEPMIVVDIVYAAVLTILFSLLLAILENLKK